MRYINTMNQRQKNFFFGFYFFTQLKAVAQVLMPKKKS